jgi:capsular exopolysaccharide synthesis family protein
MVYSTNDSNEIVKQEEEFDIKKIIFLFVRKWYWFALFGFLGLIGALGYNLMTIPKYSVSTSILIPENSKGTDMMSLFKGDFNNSKSNISDQIEIIKSYYTVRQTLVNLNWRTSWFEKDLFLWKGIYKNEPFDVKETPNFINPKGIAIYITPNSDKSYKISVDGEIYINSLKTKVKFESIGEFDQPFQNKYFNFTLLRKINNSEIPTGQYYFQFNNLNNTTLEYQDKIIADLKSKEGSVIECSIQGEEPERESDFLNELIKVYTEGKMNIQNEAQRRSLDFINEQLIGISDSLNNAGNKFTEFRSKNNIINLGEEGNLVMNNLKTIESEKVQNQMQLDYFQNLQKYLNNSDFKQVISPSVVGIQDAALNSLVLKLSELYSRRQILSFSAKENNPTLIMIDKELNQIRSQLNENLKNLIDNATRNLNSQKDRQANVSTQLNKLPLKEQQMVNIQRQYNLTNEIYTFLLQKRAETNIALASSIPDVQIIDVARPETKYQVGISPGKLLLTGFFSGLMIPMVFMLIMNFFDNRIRTQEDVENHTSIPILGNIMHDKSKTDLSVAENPKSIIAESFRTLRTNLNFMLHETSGKVISIHSTNPSEGKSYIAVNLATILAMNNSKVLIIGADLRKPKLHKIFKSENEIGLSTYLIGYNTIDQIISPSTVNNLSIINSGPIPPNPAEILGGAEMDKLIAQLRNRFDYVIIDNAPIGLVTDGLIVSNLSDLNILILRHGISHKHQVEIFNQYVAKKTITNAAILVNDIKFNEFGSTYYKHYQYEAYQNTYYADEKEGKKNRNKKTKV